MDSLFVYGGGGFDLVIGVVVLFILMVMIFVCDEVYELVNFGYIYSCDDNDLFKKMEGLIVVFEGGVDSCLFVFGMVVVVVVVCLVKFGGMFLF